MTIFEPLVICTYTSSCILENERFESSSGVCLICMCYITHDIHYIHTTPIGIIEHRIQTACVHKCQGLEGWFHKDRGKGQ